MLVLLWHLPRDHPFFFFFLGPEREFLFRRRAEFIFSLEVYLFPGDLAVSESSPSPIPPFRSLRTPSQHSQLPISLSSLSHLPPISTHTSHPISPTHHLLSSRPLNSAPHFISPITQTETPLSQGDHKSNYSRKNRPSTNSPRSGRVRCIRPCSWPGTRQRLWPGRRRGRSRRCSRRARGD